MKSVATPVLKKLAEQWLARADAASYVAKEQGGNRVVSASAEAHSRWKLLEEIKCAISGKEFFLHYQPIIHLASGKIAGYEALVRWQHPTRGVLPPLTFLPVLEETGNEYLLATEVFRLTAIKQAEISTVWPDRWISVNVTPKTLVHPRFKAICAPIVGLKMTIEVTEREPLTEEGSSILALIRADGNKIALDDYGSGESRLANLAAVDTLKIDKSLVDYVDGKTNTVCCATIKMAHEMGLACVAEGIQEATQAKLFEEMGCDYGQGWLYGKPGPLG